MQVTGYKLREALKRATARKELAQKQFSESVWAFPSDKEKLNPLTVSEEYSLSNGAVAGLQTIQQKYNQQVKVTFREKEISLALAVKLVSGYNHMERMWREAAALKPKQSRHAYGVDATSRDKDSEYLQRQVSIAECLQQAENAARLAAELRAGIATANGTSIEMELGYAQSLLD